MLLEIKHKTSKNIANTFLLQTFVTKYEGPHPHGTKIQI